MLSDLARVQGPSVQAGAIHGGVHLHGNAVGQYPQVPRQLPLTSAHFVGRRSDLARLDALRRLGRPGSPRLTVVSGPPGVGKTTLVSRWLGAVAGDFPDGQLYADLGTHGPGGPVAPGAVLERFLRALGAAAVPEGLAERTALWRSLTSSRRVAVLVDDALNPAQIMPLIPGSADCLLVVTSRRRLRGLIRRGALTHQLDVLGPESAVELLRRAGAGERVRDDRHAARSVVERCARLPLAICLAAALLVLRPWQPLRALAETLSGEGALLDLLRDEDPAVRRSLDASYRLLPPEAAHLYRVMGLLPAMPLEITLVARSAGLPLAEAERALDALTDASLASQPADGVCLLRGLVHAHARERACAVPLPALATGPVLPARHRWPAPPRFHPVSPVQPGAYGIG